MATKITSAEAWGRIYAIINNVIPGGIQHSMVKNACINPVQFFEVHRQKIFRLLEDDDEHRMTELLKHVDPMKKTHKSDKDQADFMMAFVAERDGYDRPPIFT